VIIDTSGNLYGATSGGGEWQYGVVFRVDSQGTEKVLHNFTLRDGSQPYASLVSDANGNLYGTTEYGGSSNVGTVFKVNSKGHLSDLYSFTGGADGGYPSASLILDAKGNLYGTTSAGGASNAGVVFKVSSKGNETVLYSFTGRKDGGVPLADLIVDAKGTLYGTTAWGGDPSCNSGKGCGVVYKLDSTGKETVLYSFTGGKDGNYPAAGLVMDGKGSLYGTTAWGGDLSCDSGAGCGVVYKVGPTGKETVLHAFHGGKDGALPMARVSFDAKNNLYGTTVVGGGSPSCTLYAVTGCGTVFKLTP
jgi:uncharacterized repeat protein (TIGR03803 family)